VLWVAYAPDDEWKYHPKHVEQFPDKINCVTLHFVGYILEYSRYADSRVLNIDGVLKYEDWSENKLTLH
jgi:hypothetical protein